MRSSALKGEYKDTYRRILMYLSSSNVPKEFLHEVGEDIKDLLFNAQNDGMDVKNIIGSDIEGFCKEIINTKKFKDQTLFNIIKSINLALCMSIVIALVYYIFKVQMTLNVIIVYIIDSFFCTFILGKGIRKIIIKEKISIRRIAIMLVSLFLFILAGVIFNFILLINNVIPVDSLYTVIALIIAIIVINLAAKLVKKRKTVL